jgi:tetratricopeptide (TPR) repeat protein
LESIKNEDGSRPEQVNELLSRANAELSAKSKIDQAQRSLAAGKLDETFRLLAESAGTVAFANEHAQLLAQAEASNRALLRKKDRDLKLARITKAKADNLATAAAEMDPAEKLYEEGTGLYRRGQYADAASTLNQCLRVNPDLAKCHLALATTYAKLKEPELGAQHYRRFIQLAPDDPQAGRVKLLLEEYEASKELAR